MINNENTRVLLEKHISNYLKTIHPTATLINVNYNEETKIADIDIEFSIDYIKINGKLEL